MQPSIELPLVLVLVVWVVVVCVVVCESVAGALDDELEPILDGVLWLLELLDWLSADGVLEVDGVELDGVLELDELLCATVNTASSITTHNRNSVLFIGSPLAHPNRSRSPVRLAYWGVLRITDARSKFEFAPIDTLSRAAALQAATLPRAAIIGN